MNHRPLNIVRIITFLPIGGVENSLLMTLPQFDGSRFRVSVCCTYRRGALADSLEEKGIPVHVCRVRSRLHPIDLWKLSRRLKHEKTDIVHTHMYASNITGVLAAKLAKIPVVISHIHSTHEWNSRNRIRMEKIVDRFRDGYIAVSNNVKEVFLKKAGLTCADKIKVLHNIARFTDKEAGEPNRIRDEFGIPPQSPVVGTVARLVHKKGLDVFIRAAAEIAHSYPNVYFVIVGKGKERRNLAHLTAHLGLNQRVIFTGERRDMENFYTLFTTFVLSSREEPFGNVLLEAMHFEVPIVATAVGGVPEVITNGETGLLVPPDSPLEMANAIKRLLEYPALAERLIKQGRKRVADFSPTKYVQNLEQYYEELWEKALGY